MYSVRKSIGESAIKKDQEHETANEVTKQYRTTKEKTDLTRHNIPIKKYSDEQIYMNIKKNERKNDFEGKSHKSPTRQQTHTHTHAKEENA